MKSNWLGRCDCLYIFLDLQLILACCRSLTITVSKGDKEVTEFCPEEEYEVEVSVGSIMLNHLAPVALVFATSNRCPCEKLSFKAESSLQGLEFH